MNTWLTDARAFESLFSASPSAIIAVDRDCTVIAVNTACTLIGGYTQSELTGRDLRSVADAPLRAFLEDALEFACVEKTLQRDVMVTRKDGSSFLAEVTAIPVVDGGASVYLFLVMYDASWREAAEQRFRSLFDRNPFPAAIYDAEARIVEVNEATVAHSGYPREYFVGTPLGRHCKTSVRAAFRAAFDQALGGTITRAAVDFETADGRWLNFIATLIPRNEGGRPTGVYGLFENVTVERIDEHSAQQAQTNAELEQARMRFQLLFENNPAVVLAVDANQRIMQVNTAGLRISGYALEDLRGRSVTDFVPPSQRDGVREYLLQAMKGETVSFPVDAYSADGRIIQYEATLLPMVQQQQIVGAYALMENVTERMRAERTVAAQREELLDLEGDFRSLFAHNPDGIALLSTDGVILDLNAAAATVSQRPREQIQGQNFRLFLQGTDLERGWAFFRRAVDGETVNYEIASTRGDGSPLHLETTLFPKYAQGLVVGVYCAFKDISERKIAQRKLEMQAQRMRDLYLLATTPEYTDAHVMSTLQTGCRLLGMESGAIVDSTDVLSVDMRYDSLELFAGDDELLVDLAKAVLVNREPVSTYVGGATDGAYGTWIGSRLLVGGTLHGVLLFFSRTQREQPFEEVDVDTIALMAALVGSAIERRRSRSHLRTLAYYDSLTGLPNRLFFQERLRDSLIDSRGNVTPSAVLFFDLDRFKDINDTLGHATGDRFLQIAAHRLLRTVGQSGTVARMGGDEFIVLLPGIDGRAQVEPIAQQLLHAIEEPFRVEGVEQFITTSIGIALSPDDGRDDQALIKHADIAMYRIKGQGGNGFLFYEETFQTPLRTRLSVEKNLRRAIEHQQFLLHYQPIVDVVSERILAVEALVRWKHPQRGLVYPDEFIPVAEATGMVMQLGEWVIANAGADARRWQTRRPVSLAVNISARQFHHPHLCERLLESLPRPASTRIASRSRLPRAWPWRTLRKASTRYGA